MRTLGTLTALLTLAALAAPAPALAAGEVVATRATLLIGFPAADGPKASGVLVVPGMVIPAVGKARPLDLDAFATEEEHGERMAKMAADLRFTFHLSEVEVGYSETRPVTLGQTAELPPPTPLSPLRVHLELLGFDLDTATYQVRLLEGGMVIADNRVAIPRGGQAVIGGLDGEAAPYVFLVVEPAPSADAPLRIEGDITPPRALEKVMPRYTEAARKERVTGLVIVQTVIEKDGSISDVRVLQGLPYGLSETAVEAIRQWRFEPALKDGEPVAVYYNLTVNFRLEEDKEKEAPVKVEGDISEPRVTKRVLPAYPEEARKEKAQGTVRVQAIIEKDGSVSAVEVLETPRPDLGEAAVEAIRQWRFDPARNAGGDPVRVYFTLTVNFALDGDGKKGEPAAPDVGP